MGVFGEDDSQHGLEKITIVIVFTIIMMKNGILLKPKVVAESIR